jgi:hypothetical protein
LSDTPTHSNDFSTDDIRQQAESKMTNKNIEKRSATVTLDQVEQFLAARKPVMSGRGKLIFSVDCTASRAPAWAAAQKLQSKMLRDHAGDLMLKLVYFRGNECRESAWTSDADQLAASMNKIECITGLTQIAKILRLAIREHETAGPIQAVIFIGDAFEELEDEVAGLASELGHHKLPAFVFQEGNDPAAERIFKLIAERSGGKYFRFNLKDTAGLATQLGAVATFAVTGDASVLAIAKKT